MSTNRLFTLSIIISPKTRYALRLLLIISILAGFTTACVANGQVITSDTVNNDTVQPAVPVTLTESTKNPNPTRGPGHDFGAIYSSSYPQITKSATQLPFVYWVNGQMVVRPSEFGPLGEYVESPIRANTAGQGFSTASYVPDPINRVPAIRPLITYTVNGYTVVRPSELGPLTGTVEDSPQANIP